MTGEDYQKRGAAIQKREQIVREQIDGEIAKGIRPDAPVLQPTIEAHQKIIDELGALDRECFPDA